MPYHGLNHTKLLDISGKINALATSVWVEALNRFVKNVWHREWSSAFESSIKGENLPPQKEELLTNL